MNYYVVMKEREQAWLFVAPLVALSRERSVSLALACPAQSRIQIGARQLEK
jgi:hypothetical protein